MVDLLNGQNSVYAPDLVGVEFQDGIAIVLILVRLMEEHTVKELISKAEHVSHNHVQYMEGTVSGVRMGHVLQPVVMVKNQGFAFVITLPLPMVDAHVITLVMLKKLVIVTSDIVQLMVVLHLGMRLHAAQRLVELVNILGYVFVHTRDLLMAEKDAKDQMLM